MSIKSIVNRKQKDEKGAYAILFAVLSLGLFGMAALAVDLGNSIARKSDVQGQADFAALAAAAKLPGSPPTSGTMKAMAEGDSAWMDVVEDVAAFLNQNHPAGRECTESQPAADCVDPDDLIDHDSDTGYANGEVLFSHEYTLASPDRCSRPGLCVITPRELVDYVFAPVINVPDGSVQADATVGIGSPLGAVPLYAVSGCDWGPQTLADPASGHADPVAVPPLNHDTDANNTTLESVTPNTTTVNPSTQPTVTLIGKQFNQTTKIGFFRSDDLSDGAVVQLIGGTDYTSTPNPMDGNGSITFTVPSAVTSVVHLWYIRVFSGPAASGQNKSLWSATDSTGALPFRVGDALLECDPGANSGNFGTLQLPRGDVTSQDDQIAKNLATKLQEPLSLAIHAEYEDNGECEHGVNEAVESPSWAAVSAGTNCVETKTGLPANAATQGLVTGGPSWDGRLDEPTTSGCDRLNGSAERRIDINPGGPYFINDDVLSCFLTSGATLGDIAVQDEVWTGGSMLDPSIYDSPRLIVVPVLKVDPTKGHSETYSIIGFRPGFITDETGELTVKGGSTATSENGVVQHANDIKQMKVFFFNIGALPPPPPGSDVTSYFGVGPKLVRLID